MGVLLTEVLGNSLRRWLISAAVIFGVRILLGLVRRALRGRIGRWLGRLPGVYDDALLNAVAGTRGWFLWVVALYAGSMVLKLPAETAQHLSVVFTTLISLQAGLWAQRFIGDMVDAWTRGAAREGEAPRPSTAAAAITFAASLAVWCVVGLVALQNAGIEIGALLAGLGVGGIAAALALQSILGDLFASLTIFTDRPFDLGDFIVVGDFMGTVEKVGLRSTRLVALGGEQLVMPNGELLKSRIRNYRRMQQRRVVNTIRVAYGTPAEKLQQIPVSLREIVEKVADVRFDRAHLSGFGESSLDFELVYYVLSADYNAFMDRQQAILLEISRRFEQAAIEFAVPTRSVLLRRDAQHEARADGHHEDPGRPGARGIHA